MGLMAMRKSWCTLGLGLGLVLCLAGCQSMFPQPVYAPPVARPPQAPPPPPQVIRPTVYVTVNRLNLRACPGMDCPKIAVLDRNQEVEKVGDADDWSQIRIKQNGTIGWVSSRYLSATPVAAGAGGGAATLPARNGDAAAASGNSGNAQTEASEPPGGGKSSQDGQARGRPHSRHQEKA